jgi:hypothetical protein
MPSAYSEPQKFMTRSKRHYPEPTLLPEEPRHPEEGFLFSLPLIALLAKKEPSFFNFSN